MKEWKGEIRNKEKNKFEFHEPIFFYPVRSFIYLFCLFILSEEPCGSGGIPYVESCKLDIAVHQCRAYPRRGRNVYPYVWGDCMRFLISVSRWSVIFLWISEKIELSCILLVCMSRTVCFYSQFLNFYLHQFCWHWRSIFWCMNSKLDFKCFYLLIDHAQKIQLVEDVSPWCQLANILPLFVVLLGCLVVPSMIHW